MANAGKYNPKLRKPRILFFINDTTPSLSEVKDAERLTDCEVSFRTTKVGVTKHEMGYDDSGNQYFDGVAGSIPDMFQDQPKALDLIKQRKLRFETAMVEHEKEQDKIKKDKSKKAKEEAMMAQAKEEAKAEISKQLAEENS